MTALAIFVVGGILIYVLDYHLTYIDNIIYKMLLEMRKSRRDP